MIAIIGPVVVGAHGKSNDALKPPQSRCGPQRPTTQSMWGCGKSDDALELPQSRCGWLHGTAVVRQRSMTQTIVGPRQVVGRTGTTAEWVRRGALQSNDWQELPPSGCSGQRSAVLSLWRGGQPTVALEQPQSGCGGQRLVVQPW